MMGVSPFGGGFDAMATIIPVIVVIGFIVVIGLIIFKAVQGGVEWGKNNNSPVLTVDAKIVTKRTAVSRHNSIHHNNNHAMNHHSASTAYFVTFEVDSGDRMELQVKDKAYGLLADGDVGKLTFQGTRYKGFERKLNNSNEG